MSDFSDDVKEAMRRGGWTASDEPFEEVYEPGTGLGNIDMKKEGARMAQGGSGADPDVRGREGEGSRDGSGEDGKGVDMSPVNGLYELEECKLIHMGRLEEFEGQRGRMSKRTLVFEYKARKIDEPMRVCCEAWNETLDKMQQGAYYDISLRVTCREAKDGRFFPNVSLAYANRLKAIYMQ